MKLSGAELKRIRKSLDMNQKDLAQLLESSQAYVSQLETEFAGKDLPDGVKAVFLPYLVHNHPEMYDQVAENQAYIISNISSNSEANEPQSEYKPIKYARPYYDVEVFATPGVELIEDMGYIEPQGFITVPQFSNAEMYIRVSGDSMYPKYRHGDIIPVKKVEHRFFFTYYEPYVVITKTNKMRLLKYVHPHDDDDKLLLVSYDSSKFRPQPIDKEEILALYHVLGKIEL